MQPQEPRLEVRSRVPANATKPPLLFVHGGYVDAWCWEPHFLPWFARQGHPSYALSLRGHGESAGRDLMWLAGLDDYAADVERVIAQLPAPPILVGHSMGAAIVERLVATRPVRAAVLLAPIPPAGLLPVAARLAAERPDTLLHLAMLDPMRLSRHVLAALEPFYFSERVDPDLLREATHHIRGRCSTSRCGCTGRCRSAAVRRSSSSACAATASAGPTTSRRPRATTASRRRSCPGSLT
jgi:pimeloyl-ACP methyl ester carboxylesterase